MQPPAVPAFRIVLASSLTLSALLYFVWSWRWPLVGDASLIHYISFLIERGWAPYRDLGDMNMPGSFLIEIGAMHVFGMGDLAWRIFDFNLLAIASSAFFVITKNPGAPSTIVGSVVPGGPVVPGAPFMTVPSSWVGSNNNWLAALFSASLFILIHGRDGLAEGGQRDLTMAVSLIAATAFLFLAVRKNSSVAAAAFGLLSGIAATIKPTSLPLTLAQIAFAVYTLRTPQKICHPERSAQRGVEGPGLTWSKGPALSSLRLSICATFAYFIAPIAALAFLVREHALAAFLAGLHGIVPYYASLGHKSFGFVLLHSISPLLPLVIAWVVLLALRPVQISWRNWERNALLAGLLFGLINCLVQARALPYYRYPLLAFLLPLLAIDFTRALEQTHNPGGPSFAASSQRVGLIPARLAPTLALLALAFGGLFLAPQSAILIHRYRWWETDFISTLQQNLGALGGSGLSRHVQCIDSISGCGNVLYRMRLEPATGVLSDFLLFGATSDQQPAESIPILRDTRAQFSAALLANPPEVIIVTSHLHMDGPDNFQKLARWPWLSGYLATRYALRTQWSPVRTARWWSREETPASYRIYVLRK